MLLSAYKNVIARFDYSLRTMEKRKEEFVKSNKPIVIKLVNERRKADLLWFVTNFETILNNQKLFELGTANASIIIDFFKIYGRSNKMGAKFIQRISIGKLIKLWDLGFKYKGFPVIQYIIVRGIAHITYIKNNILVSEIANQISFPSIVSQLLKRLEDNYNDLDEYKTVDEMKRILEND